MDKEILKQLVRQFAEALDGLRAATEDQDLFAVRRRTNDLTVIYNKLQHGAGLPPVTLFEVAGRPTV